MKFIKSEGKPITFKSPNLIAHINAFFYHKEHRPSRPFQSYHCEGQAPLVLTPLGLSVHDHEGPLIRDRLSPRKESLWRNSAHFLGDQATLNVNCWNYQIEHKKRVLIIDNFW